MTKRYLTLVVALFLVLPLVSQAVAIDDDITPQNCSRTDSQCASFVETTSTGQIKWGGFIAGGLRSLSNFFVDGKMGVATLRPSSGEQVLRLDVEGAVGAKFYCDENGNHCVAGGNLGGGGGGGSNITLVSGRGITINSTSSNNTYTIAIDPTTTQVRVSGVCANGSAMRQINADGTVLCQETGGAGTGDTLWQKISGTNTIKNIASDRVEISGNSAHQPVLKVSDSAGASALILTNGNGAEFLSTIGSATGVYSHTTSGTGVGIVAHAHPSSGSTESYGLKAVGVNIGSYTKGKIALYATDMANGANQAGAGRDNRIPANLVSGSAQYAGYFDGNVNINGNLNLNGTMSLNGQPIPVPHLASGQCRPGAGKSCVINLASSGFTATRPIHVVVGILSGDGSDHFQGSASYAVSGTTLTVTVQTENLSTNWLAMQI